MSYCTGSNGVLKHRLYIYMTMPIEESLVVRREQYWASATTLTLFSWPSSMLKWLSSIATGEVWPPPLSPSRLPFLAIEAGAHLDEAADII